MLRYGVASCPGLMTYGCCAAACCAAYAAFCCACAARNCCDAAAICICCCCCCCCCVACAAIVPLGAPGGAAPAAAAALAADVAAAAAAASPGFCERKSCCRRGRRYRGREKVSNELSLSRGRVIKRHFVLRCKIDVIFMTHTKSYWFMLSNAGFGVSLNVTVNETL